MSSKKFSNGREKLLCSLFVSTRRAVDLNIQGEDDRPQVKLATRSPVQTKSGTALVKKPMQAKLQQEEEEEEEEEETAPRQGFLFGIFGAK